jgi:radical SAM-linked protein
MASDWCAGRLCWSGDDTGERLGRDKRRTNYGPARCGGDRESKPKYFDEESESELRYKVAIRFAVQDDVRFISHHDTMRMFERALSRTELPVRFSEGFNPRPRLSLPLPRPVGVATLVDVLAIELTSPTQPDEVLRQLMAQMPSGVTLEEAWCPPQQRAMQPESATYAVDLPAEQTSGVGERVNAVLRAPTWPIQRAPGDSGPGKVMDLRSYLLSATLADGRLCWTVRVTGGGSIRPSEFLAAVGLEPGQWQHRVCRTAINWQVQAAKQDEHLPAPAGQ